MKKSILNFTAIVIALTSTHQIFAQKMYATIQLGYGVPSGVSTVNSINALETYTGSSTSELTAVKLALGKGVNFGGSIGYFLHKNIGVELGINYLMGGKSKIGEVDGANYSTYNYYGNFVNVKPSLILQLPLKNMNLYTKFGVIGSIGNINSHYEEKDGSDLAILHTKSSGGFGSGITSALGINLKVNKQVGLLLEINNSNATFSPSTEEVTEFTRNGANKLGDLKTYQKEFEYVSKLINSNATPSQSEPMKMLKPAYSIGNTSFNIGLRFNF